MPRENKKIKFRFEESPQGKAAEVVKLYIYDDVTARGHFNWNTWEYEESETSAKFMRDQLDQVNNNADIELHINSAGGEVSEGVAIYNLLKQKAQAGNKIRAFIDGMAYSVAMVIAMAADEIHMGLGTSMLLHYPWMLCAGNADELRNYAEQLDALGESSLQLFLHRAGERITYEELDAMMRKETMLDPETCLKYGFADVIDDYKAEKEPADDPEQLRRENVQLRQQLSMSEAGMAQIRQMLEGLKPQQKAEPETPAEDPEQDPEKEAITPEDKPGFDMRKVMVAAYQKAAERR
jgi:ATP-dependent protease ClpP protease subunit